MKCVFRVTTNEVSPQTGVPYFVNFECDEPSLSSFIASLNEGKLVVGNALYTKLKERSVWMVLRRKPMALGRAGVAKVEWPAVSFVEVEDATLAAA